MAKGIVEINGKKYVLKEIKQEKNILVLECDVCFGTGESDYGMEIGDTHVC